MYVYVHVCMYDSMYVCVNVCIYVCMCACMVICMYVCVRVWLYFDNSSLQLKAVWQVRVVAITLFNNNLCRL